jgi:hypothetical protein
VLIAAMLVSAESAAQEKVTLPDNVNLEIETYVDCVGTKSMEQVKSADPAEVIVDRAMAFCHDWSDMLLEDVMKPPLSASPPMLKAPSVG